MCCSTVEPLTNDHPHQRPSLSYDHISCNGQWFLFIYESLTSDHPSYTTTPMWFWGWSYKRGSTVPTVTRFLPLTLVASYRNILSDLTTTWHNLSNWRWYLGRRINIVWFPSDLPYPLWTINTRLFLHHSIHMPPSVCHFKHVLMNPVDHVHYRLKFVHFSSMHDIKKAMYIIRWNIDFSKTFIIQLSVSVAGDRMWDLPFPTRQVPGSRETALAAHPGVGGAH